MPLLKSSGYALQLTSGTLSPASGSTHYFGGNAAWGDSATVFRVYVPRAGTITRADLHVLAANPGSAEAATVSLRLNNTTDTTISSSVAFDNVVSNYSAVLAVAVQAGDYIEGKVVFPTFATLPTVVLMCATVFITG